MQKTKTFISQNNKWNPLREYILRIENFLDSAPGLVIENCKSLLESIFKTVLVEVNHKTAEDLKDLNIGTLYKQVKTCLFLEKRGYCNVIGSFTKALAEFRNALGETSHGKDIYTLENNRNALFHDEVNFLIATTDSISFFLLSYYTNLHPSLAEKRKELKYADNSDFNDWFDQTESPVNVGGISLSPSKTLFDGDTEAYKVQLEVYQEKDELIEGIRISPNFSSTHSFISKLSEIESFSEKQTKNLMNAFLSNNQIHLIATDQDVKTFFTSLFDENAEYLSEEELRQFNAYFS